MEKFVKTLSAEKAVMEINRFREVCEESKKYIKGVNLEVRINPNFTKINCKNENIKINKGSEKIAKMLDPKIVDVHKCKAGLNILLPLMVVTFVNRCFLPAILTPFSSVIRDKLKESKHV